MAGAPTELKFSFNGMRVGLFNAADPPTGPGRYRYIPYRSGGHYLMHEALARGMRPRCTIIANGRLVSLAVVGFPEYGVLELAEFQQE